jgi:hypothetical protein
MCDAIGIVREKMSAAKIQHFVRAASNDQIIRARFWWGEARREAGSGATARDPMERSGAYLAIPGGHSGLIPVEKFPR